MTLKAGLLRGVGEQARRLPDSWDSLAGDQEPCISGGVGSQRELSYFHLCDSPPTPPLNVWPMKSEEIQVALEVNVHQDYNWLRFGGIFSHPLSSPWSRSRPSNCALFSKRAPSFLPTRRHAQFPGLPGSLLS